MACSYVAGSSRTIEAAPGRGRSTSPLVTIVTHAGSPEGVADDHLLAAAITELGGEPRFAVWSDPSVNWAVGTLAVVRSTWDYHLHPGEWFRWLDRASRLTRLVNAPDLLRWNSEKTYLIDLASRGVPIVPTVLLRDAARLAPACAERGWGDVVVKPAIGASALGARRFRGREIGREGAAHMRDILSGGAALLQPYQDAIETARERSLVFVDGAFCHAYSKPGFHAGLGDADLPLHRASEDELRVAGRVLAALPAAPTFARVDLLPSDAGPLVMEAELIEPQLALHLCPDASARLARALIRAAAVGRGDAP